jgi:MFS family permease
VSAHPVGAGGLRRYAAVLEVPQLRRLFVAAFVGRLPVGMHSLGIVLLLSKETGSYALAGGATAAFAIASGLTAPPIGRLIDRIGQTPVLVVCAIGFPVSVGALIAVADGGAETLPVLACSAVTGITFPPLFATLRALITELAGGLADTAFALEAVVQELFFIVGPLLVALVVAISTTEAALGLAAVLVAAGALAFAATPASRSWRGKQTEHAGAGALTSPGIRTIVVSSVVDGMTFGSLEVALPAFGQSHGSASAAGVMLGTLAFGSMLGGLWYGAREWRRDAADLLIVFSWPLALGLAPLALAGSIPVMTVLLFIAGLSIAPSAAACFALVGRLAPGGAVTEAFTWLSTGVTAGFAVGGAFAGVLVQQVSVDAALLTTAGCALAAAAILFARRATLRVQAPVTAAAHSGGEA